MRFIENQTQILGTNNVISGVRYLVTNLYYFHNLPDTHAAFLTAECKCIRKIFIAHNLVRNSVDQ